MASQGTSHREHAPAARGEGHALSAGELKMMLGQCLKMASENKITGQNTWGLPLIEHLDDLIKEDTPGQHTNFQRASVTLDAGVKIYSYRVDSVHTETFKILGGLGRASAPIQEEDGDAEEAGGGGSPSKRKRRGGELNPEATLEPSLEALNIKKFDLAFAVDPLFHKTSAQFDEGGARGLLLNNLSVYVGCEIVFDSQDVPERALDAAAAVPVPAAAAAAVTLDGVTPQLEALAGMTGAERVSPSLDDILALLGAAPAAGAAAEADEFVQRVAKGAGSVGPWAPGASTWAPAPETRLGSEDTAFAPVDVGQHPADDAAAPPTEYGAGGDDDAGAGGYDDFGGGYDDRSDREDGGGAGAQGASSASGRGGDDGGGDALGEDAISWLIAAGGASASGGYVTAAKGWAGASHWRYRAVPQDAAHGGEEGGQPAAGGKGRRKAAGGPRRRNDPLDFVALMAAGATAPEFELLPRAARTTSRRARPAAKTLLPEDHHYRAEALARYALRPRNVVAMPGANPSAGDRGYAPGGGDAGAADFGDEHGFGGGDFDDDDAGGDGDAGANRAWDFASGNLDDGLDLVQAAHKVDKVEVNYSRAAKQVDVRSLKELMWRGIQVVLARRAPGAGGAIEFADVLASVPASNPAGRLEDLSVHLCFICVLHLANEHGLVVGAVPGLDRLLISNVPAPA